MRRTLLILNVALAGLSSHCGRRPPPSPAATAVPTPSDGDACDRFAMSNLRVLLRANAGPALDPAGLVVEAVQNSTGKRFPMTAPPGTKAGNALSYFAIVDAGDYAIEFKKEGWDVAPLHATAITSANPCLPEVATAEIAFGENDNPEGEPSRHRSLESVDLRFAASGGKHQVLGRIRNRSSSARVCKIWVVASLESVKVSLGALPTEFCTLPYESEKPAMEATFEAGSELDLNFDGGASGCATTDSRTGASSFAYLVARCDSESVPLPVAGVTVNFKW